MALTKSEHNKLYYQRHRAACKKRSRAWREANPEKVAAYYAANKEKFARNVREWRKKKAATAQKEVVSYDSDES